MAGDPERAHMRKVEEDGGIYYHINLVEAMVGYDANYRVSSTQSLSLPLLVFGLHRTILSEH